MPQTPAAIDRSSFGPHKLVGQASAFHHAARILRRLHIAVNYLYVESLHPKLQEYRALNFFYNHQPMQK